MPSLDHSHKHTCRGSSRCYSLRPTEAFHSRRNHSLGRIAGCGIGGQRPRSRHSSIRRKRLHCAGWRCHARQAFGVRRTVLLTKVEQTQSPVFEFSVFIRHTQTSEWRPEWARRTYGPIFVISWHGKKPWLSQCNPSRRLISTTGN